jgi:hypothetical protein
MNSKKTRFDRPNRWISPPSKWFIPEPQKAFHLLDDQGILAIERRYPYGRIEASF